jgi:hypothetical protein
MENAQWEVIVCCPLRLRSPKSDVRLINTVRYISQEFDFDQKSPTLSYKIPIQRSMFQELFEFLKLPVGWWVRPNSVGLIATNPSSYLPDFLRKRLFHPRLEYVQRSSSKLSHSAFTYYQEKGDRRFGMVTLADLSSGITVGVLYTFGFLIDEPSIDEILTNCKLLHPLVGHPLLLPLTMMQQLLYKAGRKLFQVSRTLDDISADLRFVDDGIFNLLAQSTKDSKGHDATSGTNHLMKTNQKIVSCAYILSNNIFSKTETLRSALSESMSFLQSSHDVQDKGQAESWRAASALFDKFQMDAVQLKPYREDVIRLQKMLATTVNISTLLLLEYVRCRLTIFAKLHNRIAQEDNSLNYSLAADTRRIAAASRRDSSAMKTIAVLTTVFLPGTFVAVSCRLWPDS